MAYSSSSVFFLILLLSVFVLLFFILFCHISVVLDKITSSCFYPTGVISDTMFPSCWPSILHEFRVRPKDVENFSCQIAYSTSSTPD